MQVSAIVLAAGKGLRLKSKVSKLLTRINYKPILIYCLEVLNQHPYIKDIILVTNSENTHRITNKIKKYRIDKIREVILGGRRRQDSVKRGLEALDNTVDLVLIHDGVRPFIDKNIISSLIKEADRYGAAVVGVPVKATIKSVKVSKCQSVRNGFVIKKTLDRKNLWEIQTPQVFKKDLILKAYETFGNREVTDDASLVERLGVKIRLVKGSYFNIKITTPEDLILAEAIAKRRRF